jgi:PHD/YefM family antitoxin component YafN of YafNO toxin-antitoxin module
MVKAKTKRASLIRKKRKVRATPSMVMISKQEYEGLKETIYLLSNPANAQDLLAAIAEANAGKFIEGELIDE